ncbi:hypothetical protein P3H15_47520 [Rhodococcus sp. T2V]|uniref:hypothetical protein n=1 Tax=Rhodococcus sp. T2V TaxID=3034164 RepID=UPI0023E2F55E|nr:hypothetical protein [Rhodococcus sp. T2V]MDF3312599.1 hypothetical protein [Rhodococcus sp. T2V]
MTIVSTDGSALRASTRLVPTLPVAPITTTFNPSVDMVGDYPAHTVVIAARRDLQWE